MILRSRYIFAFVFLVAISAMTGLAQTPVLVPSPTVEKSPEPTPEPLTKDSAKSATPEQVVESTIFLYGYPRGRETLNQIRKTTQERGTSNVTNAEGKVEKVIYQRYVIRAETLNKEKVRLDQEFPGARYSLVHSDDKIFGIYNNSVFAPREDASKSFENQIVHGLEALLRYKENESKIELADREKLMGVDFYVVDLTDKENNKTRFFISAKSFRVMMLTYEDAGVKYKRKFYDYNYAQGTLVPFRTVLWGDGKIIEETNVGTITFGQKVDDGLFTAS